jgi:HAD superfamily hydrolase (TIGR01509 family)
MVVGKAAVFDVDGTLVDSVDQHARAWQDALRDFGIECTFDAARAQVGKGADQILPVFMPQDSVDSQGEKIVAHRLRIFRSKYLPQIQPFPCVRELFERIHANGMRIALASSAKADELDGYVRLVHVEGLVDVQVSSNDAKRSKPYPDIFLAALQKLNGITASEAVAVGDTPYDAEAARSAQMRAIGLLCGGFPEHGLREAGCEAIYRDPEDLLGRFDESPLIAQKSPAGGGLLLRN